MVTLTNIYRYKRVDYPGLMGAFIASWILHCGLFAIAATTTIFYPPTADREMISIDLFFSTPGSGDQPTAQQSLPFDKPIKLAEEAPASKHDPGVIQTSQPPDDKRESNVELVAVKTPKKDITRSKLPVPVPLPISEPKETSLPEQKPVPIPAPENIPTKKDAREIPTAEVPPPAEMSAKSKSIDNTEEEKQAIENEKLRRMREAEQRIAAEQALQEQRATAERVLQEQRAAQAELERIERDKAAKARIAEEKARTAKEKARAELAAQEQAQRDLANRLKREEERLAREKENRQRLAAEKAAKERLELARKEAKAGKSEPVTAAKQPSGNRTGSTLKANVATVTAVTSPKKSASNVSETDKNKMANEQKGLALPPVKGDIKLIMTSEEDLVVKVLFLSHPKARHDKPLSKKETREQQKLNPVVVKSAKNTAEAVIEHTMEGIYIFIVEQSGTKPVTGKFSLKLFETKNRKITEREIRGQTEVARLLMPEGILWEDDSAFTGNIEDSESITKFNSDSGIIWKEYRK